MASNKFFRLQRIKQQLKRFVALPMAFVSLIMFLYFSFTSHPMVEEGKRAIYDSFIPVMSVVSSPIETVVERVSFIKNYVNVYAENERLRAENKLLKGWQNTAYKLALEQKELLGHLNYQPLVEAKTKLVRMLGEFNSPFSHSIVLEGGTQNGIHKGDVLIKHNALFGHVIEVNLKTSRALKLTDYFSRLPVFVGEGKVPAILMGNNSDMPELIALPEEHFIQEGDWVITAGIAGVYPEGLMIGKVEKEDTTYKVKLLENESNDSFVQVVHFDLGGLIEPSSIPQKEGH